MDLKLMKKLCFKHLRIIVSSEEHAKIPGELAMLLRELRDFDRKRKVACSQNVDHAVVEEPSVEPQLLK